MSDGLNVRFNVTDTNNIFIPSSTPSQVESSANDYNFVSKTYNPVIEDTDTEGDVQIEDSNSKNKDDESAMKTMLNGSLSMAKGSGTEQKNYTQVYGRVYQARLKAALVE